MKVALRGYRDWANRIFMNLTEFDIVDEIKDADVVLYYGWSEMIPKDIYENKLCLILHPSPLPKYRGGSPIQHQIMSGETMSAVTICRVTDKLDAGEIYSQIPFSLEGTLDEIFERIIDIGTKETIRILANIDWNQLKSINIDQSNSTYFKRRTPEQSELTLKDFENKSAKELYNFIRALTDPYPNAFIKCKDGKKLYITGVHL